MKMFILVNQKSFFISKIPKVLCVLENLLFCNHVLQLNFLGYPSRDRNIKMLKVNLTNLPIYLCKYK